MRILSSGRIRCRRTTRLAREKATSGNGGRGEAGVRTRAEGTPPRARLPGEGKKKQGMEGDHGGVGFRKKFPPPAEDERPPGAAGEGQPPPPPPPPNGGTPPG